MTLSRICLDLAAVALVAWGLVFIAIMELTPLVLIFMGWMAFWRMV